MNDAAKKEFGKFLSNMMAGVFGGIVIFAYSIAYDAFKNADPLIKIFMPMLLMLITFGALYVIAYRIFNKTNTD